MTNSLMPKSMTVEKNSKQAMWLRECMVKITSVVRSEDDLFGQENFHRKT